MCAGNLRYDIWKKAFLLCCNFICFDNVWERTIVYALSGNKKKVVRYGGEYFFFLSLLITFRSAKVLMYLVKLLVSQLVGPPSVSIGLMELVILFSFSIFLSFFIGRLWFSVVLI